MARLKRYELYEGDGEEIREEYVPLQEREKKQEVKQPPRNPAQEPRNRYFARREDDGLGPAVSPLFDDFDRFNSQKEPEQDRKYRKQEPKHYNGGWVAVIICCLVILAGLGVLMVPQLTGVQYRFLPNIGFMNGSLIVMDRDKAENHEACADEIYTDRIYQGIYIDDIHVGGMTKEQAIRKLEEVNGETDAKFDLVVSVGNESWHVNSERVPVSRNIRETVDRAWACGRGNTTRNTGSGRPPFEERVSQASDLRSYPQTYRTKQDYDHEALRMLTDGIVNYVDREPVNSQVQSFNFSTREFTFTDDLPGAKIDPEDLYSRLTTLLDSGVTNTTVRVVPQRIEAEMTKAELMNRFGLISAYTTNTTDNRNRNTNIQLSAAAINGITVKPGEIFSFNATTGERTAEKGYKEAAAISGGQSKDEIGGGVCQTSSTLFNAVARADLEIIERNPHAWPSNYVEKGFDATVNWPGLDFKFKNNTDWPVFIVAAYSKQKVTVNIYGMSLGPGVKIDLESEVTRKIPKPADINYVINENLAPGQQKTTVKAREGYEVQTWKIWYQGDREIKREILFKTTYKAYQQTVEYNP